MANIVLMPQLGISEETAVLSKWNVKKGDEVKSGQILFTLETGKASFDVESEFSGTVLALLCGEGDELPIKAPVCAIGTAGEAFELPTNAPSEPSEKTAEEKPADIQPATAVPEAVSAVPVAGGELHASPRARKLAEKAGLDLSAATPTGPEGRIIERDVAAALDAGLALKTPEAPAPEIKSAEPVAEVTEEPVSGVRKVIAKNMHASLSEMAQLTLNTSFDCTALLALRKSAKAGVIPGFEGVTLNDMVLFAVSRTVLDFPYVNAHFLGDKYKLFHTANVGFACDTDKGLLVPVIKSAEKLSLLEVSKKAKALAKDAQSGKLAPADMSGGSITVSNLGSLGVESFTPVINPPQTCILGVDCAQTKVRLDNGVPVYYQAMGLSLTFDHRALDGAPAAKFLKALCTNLENLPLLLAK